MSAVVKQNLVYQQLWTEVDQFDVGDFALCAGLPPKKLHPDDSSIEKEYVLTSYTKDDWTIEQWAQVFAGIKQVKHLEREPRRIIMAMITDDSTVVYYIVHNGLAKPRKN